MNFVLVTELRGFVTKFLKIVSIYSFELADPNGAGWQAVKATYGYCYTGWHKAGRDL
jgi:hypothetical protein